MLSLSLSHQNEPLRCIRLLKALLYQVVDGFVRCQLTVVGKGLRTRSEESRHTPGNTPWIELRYKTAKDGHALRPTRTAPLGYLDSPTKHVRRL